MSDDDLRVEDLRSFHFTVDNSRKGWVIGPGISDILLRRESGLGFTPLLRFSESHVTKGVVFLLMLCHIRFWRPVCVVVDTRFFFRLLVSTVIDKLWRR